MNEIHPPSLLQKIFNLTEASAQLMQHALAKGQVLASEEEMIKRQTICMGCEGFDKEKAVCNFCGCGIRIKSRLESSKCPHPWGSRWLAK